MAKLYIEAKNTSYNIDEKPIIVGRSSKCDIPVSDSHFSRHHFEIAKDQDSYYVKDLNSYNGTLLNNKKITHQKLSNQDKIVVGKMCFIFISEEITGCENTKENSCFLLLGKPKKWKHKVSLRMGKNTIGRKKNNDITLPDDQISSFHAELYIDETGAKIKDLGSRNGTLLNYRRMEANCNYLISDNDLLQFGSCYCLFKNPAIASAKAISQKKWAHVLLPVISVSLLMGVFVILYYLQNSLQSSFIPGNLVDNFSFESDGAWQYTNAQRVEDNENAKQGLYFVSMMKGMSQIKYWEDLSISYGKNYSVGCWLQYQSSDGRMGFKLTWECEQDSTYTLERYIPLPTGSFPSWQKYEYIISPPPYAKNFKISFMSNTNNQSDYVYLDNFTIVSTDERNTFLDSKELEYNDLRVQVDSCGNISSYRSKKMIFSSSPIRIWQDEKLVDELALNSGQLIAQSRSISWTTENPYKFSINMLIVEDGVEIELAFPESILTDKQIEYSFNIPINYAREAQIIRSTEILIANVDNLPQEEITQIVWKEEQLGIIYQEPALCSISAKNNSLILHQKFTNLTNNKIHIKIKTNYLKDEQALQQLKNEVVKEENNGALGQVYKTYQKMLGNYFVYEEKISPQVEMERLLKKCNIDTSIAWERLETAKFFNQPSLYDDCVSFCKDRANVWNGMDEAQEFEKIIKISLEEKQEILKQRNEKKIEPLITQAENWQKQEKYALALLYLEEAALIALEHKYKEDIKTQMETLKKKISERE